LLGCGRITLPLMEIVSSHESHQIHIYSVQIAGVAYVFWKHGGKVQLLGTLLTAKAVLWLSSDYQNG